jgi:hypothetical protein
VLKVLFIVSSLKSNPKDSEVSSTATAKPAIADRVPHLNGLFI